MAIEHTFFKETILGIGEDYIPILVDGRTDRVVKAFVRGKWVDAAMYSVWQECYEAQQKKVFVRPE